MSLIADRCLFVGYGQETSARMLINSERYILHRLLIEFNRHDQDGAFRLGEVAAASYRLSIPNSVRRRGNLQPCYEMGLAERGGRNARTTLAISA